jgi:hypothetical protein
MAKTTTMPITMSQVKALFAFDRRTSSMEPVLRVVEVGDPTDPGAAKLNTLVITG